MQVYPKLDYPTTKCKMAIMRARPFYLESSLLVLMIIIKLSSLES